MTEMYGPYRVDTSADGYQTITDTIKRRTWGGMHISSQNNAYDAIDALEEERAMRDEE